MRKTPLMFASLLFALACDRSAAVLILDARPSRALDNTVVVDVELEAVEQGGAGVGPYCVSIHWFNAGFNPDTPPLAHYQGELDQLEQCAKDLSDGDQRTYRFVSHKTDLPVGASARVQVRHGGTYQTKGVDAP